MSLRFTTSKLFAASSLCALSGYTYYRYKSSATQPLGFKDSTSNNTMTVNRNFQTVFAVPLSCDNCIKSVSDAIHKLGGITKVEGNLKDQLISVEGSAAPSKIVAAIQDTGKDAILRGSGVSDSAAVSILESFAEEAEIHDDDPQRQVRGVARMVEVGSGRTLIDLTVRGVTPGTYRATIREYGDLKDGAGSTGPIWKGADKGPNGALGIVEVGKDGRGAAFVDHGFQIWEVIGHAMVLTKQQEQDSKPLQNDRDTVVGVIARSAGVWDNDKTVCSCTGKTLWEERKEEVAKGML